MQQNEMTEEIKLIRAWETSRSTMQFLSNTQLLSKEAIIERFLSEQSKRRPNWMSRFLNILIRSAELPERSPGYHKKVVV